MSTFTVTLPMSHETKNTIVYKVDREQKLPIDTLYVQKMHYLAAGVAWPKAIKVTVEPSQ
jgi:hypothetical protein